jgi:Tol biopolymer transport system component
MSPDGRYIVFFSDHSGQAYRIWRMDADGSNQKQLTNGNGEFAPQFTPDGQWVIFWSWTWSGTPRLGKVSIDGGEPVQLTNYDSRIPAISPDGKLIAAGHANETDFKTQLLIIPAEGGPPLKSFDLPNFIWGRAGMDA